MKISIIRNQMKKISCYLLVFAILTGSFLTPVSAAEVEPSPIPRAHGAKFDPQGGTVTALGGNDVDASNFGGNIPGFGTTRARGSTAGDMGLTYDATAQEFRIPANTAAASRIRYAGYNEITKFYFTVVGGTAPGTYLAEYDFKETVWKYTQFEVIDNGDNLMAALTNPDPHAPPIMLKAEATIDKDDFIITRPILIVGPQGGRPQGLTIAGKGVVLDTWLAIMGGFDNGHLDTRIQQAIHITGDGFKMTKNGVLGGGDVIIDGNSTVLGEVNGPDQPQVNGVNFGRNVVSARLFINGDNTKVYADLIQQNGNQMLEIRGNNTEFFGGCYVRDGASNPWWFFTGDGTIFHGTVISRGHNSFGWIGGANITADTIELSDGITVTFKGDVFFGGNPKVIQGNSTVILDEGSRIWNYNLTGRWIDGSLLDVRMSDFGSVAVGNSSAVIREKRNANGTYTSDITKGTLVINSDVKFLSDLAVNRNGEVIIEKGKTLEIGRASNLALSLQEPLTNLFPGGRIFLKQDAKLYVHQQPYTSQQVIENGNDIRIRLYGETRLANRALRVRETRDGYTFNANATEVREGYPPFLDFAPAEFRVYTTPETIGPCEHDFDTGVVIKDTCEVVGGTLYTCASCGFQDLADPVDVFNSGKCVPVDKSVSPVCIEDGQHLVVCSVCGAVLEGPTTIPGTPCGLPDCEHCNQSAGGLKALILSALKTFEPTNNTTAQDILNVLKALKTNDILGIEIMDFLNTAATSKAPGSVTGRIQITGGAAVDAITIDLAIPMIPEYKIPFDPKGGTIILQEAPNNSTGWAQKGILPGFGTTRANGSTANDMVWDWVPEEGVFRIPERITATNRLRYLGYNEMTKFFFDVTGGEAPGKYLGEKGENGKWTFTQFVTVTNAAQLWEALDDKDNRNVPIYVDYDANIDKSDYTINRPMLTSNRVLTISGDNVTLKTWMAAIGSAGNTGNLSICISGDNFKMTSNGVLGGGGIYVTGNNAVLGEKDPTTPRRTNGTVEANFGKNLISGLLTINGQNTTVNADVIIFNGQHMYVRGDNTIFNGDLIPRQENSNGQKQLAANVTFNGKMLVPGYMCAGFIASNVELMTVSAVTDNKVITFNDEVVFSSNYAQIACGATVVLNGPIPMPVLSGTWINGSTVRGVINAFDTTRNIAVPIYVGLNRGEHIYRTKYTIGGTSTTAFNAGTLVVNSDIFYLGDLYVALNGQVIIEEGKSWNASMDRGTALILQDPTAPGFEPAFPGGRIFLKPRARLNVHEGVYSQYNITEGSRGSEQRIMLYGTETFVDKSTEVMPGYTFDANAPFADPPYLRSAPANFRVYSAPSGRRPDPRN